MRWSDLVAYERGTMWAIEPAGDVFVTVLPLAAATFDEARRDRAEEVAAAMGLDDAEAVIQRLDAGRRCFVARVDGAVAAYGWVSQGEERIGELERAFHLAAGEAYIWDCATLPAYRQRGLYGALLSYMVARLREDGVRLIWIGASLGNQPSVRGFASAGFQPVITLTYLRLMGISRVRIHADPAAPPGLAADARAALNGVKR